MAVACPPTIARWNLALRFGLEIVALVGLAVGSWASAPGSGRLLAVVAAPLAAVVVWGLFNVVGDPSRSGTAPVEVAGWTRLAIELVILGAGSFGFVLAGRPIVGIAVAVLVALHYAASWPRVQWLIEA